MFSSIVFVPNEICRAAASLLLFDQNISAVLLFPSSILLRTITTGDVITCVHRSTLSKLFMQLKLLLLHHLRWSLFEMTDHFL